MVIKYTTKRDINGNRKTLIIDTEKRTISRGYNTAWSYEDYITVTNRERLRIADEYEAQGFALVWS